MENKIKVYNPQKFDVGVVTLDRPMGVNIKAGSFILMTEDDLNYLASVSTIIQRGLLRVEEKATEVLEAIVPDMAHDENFIDDEDIKKKLSASAKKIEEWLKDITEEYILDRIYDIAKSMDLSMAKVKVLQDKMPSRDFIN